ncbi:DEAD/DEAH box helicase [Sporomusa aerivorans]|uniref:DEAD/DEAH box helicase n=1 Tax=Sporomusa aerivorans TaxID=204936 RepID=UPI00352BB704
MPLIITLANNIRIRGANTPIRAKITADLTIPNPEYEARKAKKRPLWGIEKYLRLYSLDGNDIIVPRGYMADLLKIPGVKDNPETTFSVQLVLRPPVDFGEWNPQYRLRMDQDEAIQSLKGAESGILVAPAGSGKTVMGIRLIKELRQPALWLTHTKDLLYQSRDAAKKLLSAVGKIGILGDGKHEWGDGKLFLATVQTLGDNPKLVETLKPLIGNCIIDEAHHFPATSFVDLAGQFAPFHMYGLTATPERKDKLEVYMYRGIGPIVHEIKREGLYETGRLIKPEIKFIFTRFDYEQAADRNELGSVDAGGEDLDYRVLMDRLVADEARAKLIAGNILEHAQSFSIVITESVRYCHILADMVECFAKTRWGVVPRIAIVHGSISRYKWIAGGTEKNARQLVAAGEALECRHNERLKRWEVQVEQYTEEEFKNWQISNVVRKEQIAACRAGNVDILFATAQLVQEGLDLPNLCCGHLAMPKRGDAGGSKNGASVEQAIGRLMRPDPGNPNKKAIWFDYVDYDVGVLRSQYYSRRSVYKRLELLVPAKPKTERDEVETFLDSMPW